MLSSAPVVRIIGLAFCFMTLSTVVHASDLDLCREGGRRPETQLAACTRLIQADALDNTTLTEVLVARASAYSDPLPGSRAGPVDRGSGTSRETGTGRRETRTRRGYYRRALIDV